MKLNEFLGEAKLFKPYKGTVDDIVKRMGVKTKAEALRKAFHTINVPAVKQLIADGVDARWMIPKVKEIKSLMASKERDLDVISDEGDYDSVTRDIEDLNKILDIIKDIKNKGISK